MAEQYGAINISTANAIGAMLNKKMGVQTGFAPKDWPETSNLLVKLPTKTVSGSVASFSDGADTVPLSSCKATIAPNLEGVSSVGVVHCGKNFIDFPDNLTTGTSGGFTFSKASNGGISFSGTATGTFAYITPKFDFKIPSGKQFTLSRDTAFSFRHYVQLTFSDDTTASVVINVNETEITYTPAKDVIAVRLIMSQLTAQTAYSGTVYIQIEFNSSATAYEAYTAPTVSTVNLGRTIYGGSVDVVQGTGTDYGLWVNMSDIAWTEDANRAGVFYGSVSGRKTATADDPSDVLGCTCYDVNNVTVTTGIDNYISGARSYGGNIIFFRDSSFHGYTRAQVQEALQGEKVCVVSANPTDFTFTSTPINSLYGVNNLWNNVGGNTEVTYRRDCDLALQESEA